MTTKVLFIGDSLVDGVQIGFENSVQAVLQNRLDLAGRDVTIFDHAFPGARSIDHSGDGYFNGYEQSSRINVSVPLAANSFNAAIIYIGANDIFNGYENNDPTLELEVTRAAVQKIVDKLRGDGIDDILLIGANAIWPDEGTRTWRDHPQPQAFEQVFEDLAADNGILFQPDFIDPIVDPNNPDSYILPDGLHLTRDGAEAFVDNVEAKVNQLLDQAADPNLPSNTGRSDAPQLTSGDTGSDTYTISAPGDYLIRDLGGNDTLALPNSPAAEVTVRRDGDDFTVTTTAGQTITVLGHFANTNPSDTTGNRIETLALADGTIAFTEEQIAGLNNGESRTLTPSSSVGGAIIAEPLIEAEDMDLSAGLSTEPQDFASSGEVVRVANQNGSGTLSATFQQNGGTYDIAVSYLDESDGTASFVLRVDGAVLGSWTANQTAGGAGPVGALRLAEMIESVSLSEGAQVALEIQGDGGEFARVDSVRFTPVEDNSTPNSTPLIGTPSRDVIRGTPFDDVIAGRAGPDRLIGEEGDDTIEGEEGGDFLSGGDGDDTIAADRIDRTTDAGGEAGNDLRGNAGDDTLIGGDNDDRLLAGADNDLLIGNGGDDELRGNTGDDIHRPGTGNDRIIDGPGVNTIDYADLSFAGLAGSVAGLDIDTRMQTPQPSGGPTGIARHSGDNVALGFTDTLRGIDDVIGTSRNDRMTGDGRDNLFDGGAEIAGASTSFADRQGGDSYVVMGDVVEYLGRDDFYSLVREADGSVTVTSSGPQQTGVDTLVDIEFVYFSRNNALFALEDLAPVV